MAIGAVQLSRDLMIQLSPFFVLLRNQPARLKETIYCNSIQKQGKRTFFPTPDSA